MSAVLPDNLILMEMEKHDHIIIDPFDKKQLNNCSYNVTLSEHFFRERRNTFKTVRPKYFNPWCEKHVRDRWYQGEVEVADVEKLGLKAGDKYITLNPRETILVATQEFIGARGHITTMVKGRSSIGRSLLSVCNGAGWGDIGYINRWTLMLTNLSNDATVVLPVGCSVAQIIFLESGYTNNPYKGKYQNMDWEGKSSKEIIKELRENWSPRDILPQAYLDKENSSNEGAEVAVAAEVENEGVEVTSSTDKEEEKEIASEVVGEIISYVDEEVKPVLAPEKLDLVPIPSLEKEVVEEEEADSPASFTVEDHQLVQEEEEANRIYVS